MAQRIKEISDIYDNKLKQLKEPKEWENTLKSTSNFWRLSFCESMLLLEQNPRAKMCGTLAQWNKIGRFVNRGERSVAVFKHRTDTQLMYLFDVSQTYGKYYNAKWKMSENIADGIVGKYNAENEEKAVSLEDYLQKSIDKHVEIVYNYNGDLNAQISKDPRILRFIRDSAECICMTRCGIDKGYDFSDAAHFSDDISIIEMGNAANALAQEVLREVDRIIRRKEYELYRAGVCGRHLRYSLRGGQQRTEKSDVSELRQSADDTNGTQSSRFDERNRPDSARLGEYERTVSDDMERNRTESGGRSDASNGEPVENNNVEYELQRTSETAGGNRADSEQGGVGGSANERELAVTGSSQTAETETDKGNSAEYSELTDSYSDISEDEDEDEEEYDETVSDDEDTVSYFSDKPVNIDSDTDFAQKLLVEEVLRGSGFEYSKFRIYDFVKNNNPNVNTLAKFLKKEYGIGGGSRDRNPVLWQNHDNKGLSLEIKSESGERQVIKYTWNKVAAAVKNAISDNKYITKSDWEQRKQHAIHEAKRHTLHYAFPECMDNRRIDYIRGELNACGIDFDIISLNAEKWAVYASEYVRGIQTVKDEYQGINRSNINVNVPSVYQYSAAVDAAKDLKSDSYNSFVKVCKDATSELVSHLLAKDKGFPALGYTDEEIAEFFAGNKATADETVKEIAAQAFGYLYAVEQRDIYWQKHKEQEKQKAAINNSEDDLQLTLFGNDENESVAENEDTPAVSENTEEILQTVFVKNAIISELFENGVIRNAHENSDKQEFVLETEKAINDYLTDLITGNEPLSHLTEEEVISFYNKFYNNGDFKSRVVSEISERLDEKLTDFEQKREKFAEMGIPFSERTYNGDEDYDDPYAYDGSMSVEDSRKAADANNLDNLMEDYSDELKQAVSSYSIEEFRGYYETLAAKALCDYALNHNDELWYKDMLNSSDYLKEICDLTSDSLYNEMSTEIASKTREIHSDEIPADVDKFYINRENETVTWIYYNPDSSAGGQFVHTHIDFDDLFVAVEKEDPLEYLMENCKQTTLDIDAEGFNDAAEEFMSDSEDISSREENYIDKLLALSEPIYEIYQLKDEERLRDYHFSNSEYLKQHDMQIDRENYNRVYRGRLQEGKTLEDIYRRFNIDHPEDFRGHSLSVSDIICVKSNGTTAAYYVDSVGFTKVPDFIKTAENQLDEQTEELAQSTANEERALKVGDVIEFDGGKFEVTKINDNFDEKKYEMRDMQLTGWYPISRVVYGDQLEQYGYKLLKSATENDEKTAEDVTAKETEEQLDEQTEELAQSTVNEENYIDKLLALSEPIAEITEIKNLAQLKRALTVGAEFEITSAYRTDVANQLRRVNYADTTGIYSIRPDAADDRVTLANDGRGSYLAWGKSSDWTFADGLCTCYQKDKEHTPENVVFTLKVNQRVLEKEHTQTQAAEQEEVPPKLKEIVIDLTARPERVEVPVPSPVVEETTSNVAPVNYHFSDDFEYPKGEKGRYNANVAAIKTLKQIERQHRQATAEEQEILAHYSGWGGTANAFDETKEEWRKEYAELKELLTEKEYKAARESTLTAFYTEPYIIKSIYKALENFGFEGGYVLEPSCATGNFFGNMPQTMAENSRLFGVELDSLSARIAKQLYPNAEIQHIGFEKTKFDNDTFDVVVGNVPFGNFQPYDENYDDDYLIHDYFFKKSLDKLKSGGIMALITSSGTMDKYRDKIRQELYKKADFVGGIRLPEDAFRSAGTKTVTDILFFQKIDTERKIPQFFDSEPQTEWLRVGEKYYSNDNVYVTANQYFLSNPQNVLGKFERVSGRYGGTITVKSIENEPTSEKLDKAIESLTCQFSAEPTVEELLQDDEEVNTVPIPKGVQPYTYYISDNKLYYAENNNGVLIEGKNEPRLKAMCEIIESLERLNIAQISDCSDGDLKKHQDELNSIYDKFVKKYSYLNNRTNKNLFNDDVRAPMLSAIENVYELPDGTQNITKADVFSQRTINVEKAVTHVDTALEAMHLSLNAKQMIDLDYISQLCGKDKDEVIEELGERIYCNPAKNTGGKYTGWESAEEYLSGNVKTKLALAQEVAKENSEFERNVNALLENQPLKIDITNIGFRLGTIYIPLEMIQDFVYETFETPVWLRAGKMFGKAIEVHYTDELNQWKITNSSMHKGVLVDETYGTSRLSAYELAELLLNQKRAIVNDYVQDKEGKVKKIFNAKETILARECQDKIEQAFHNWIMADKSRIETVENIFNERYNNIKPRTYNGDYIKIPNMNPNLELRQHQKDVIARIAATGTCMMAHEVGAGKTAAMGAAGMYLKSIGACTKPLYVVPNAVVGQFAEELQRFFPRAKVLAATSKDLEKTNRRRFLSKIAVGNYDAIIIPQSAFEKIPLSLERQEKMYLQKMDELIIAIQRALEDRNEKFTVKMLESQKKSLQKKLDKLRADFKKDAFITFEELGCDFMFVDEAHNYKNLAVFTKMNNVAGVNASANSQKAFDMEMKCRYLQEINNGGGVVFATGTPISNSITELYVWQYLLQKQKLDDMEIGYFDNWASVFGDVSQSLEVKPSGDGFRMRTRFSNFVNLNELCNLFGEVFDVAKTADMNLNLPNVIGGKPEMIICDKSPEQEEQTEVGIERARRIEERLVKPEEDNMLAVCSYMTKVALDARILDESAEEYEGGKVALCANKIIEIKQKNPDVAQAVFCDTSIPKKDAFSVYQALKDRLVKSGEFAENEIAFVHDAATDSQRLAMFEKVNKAEIKVIIGSTGKLGTGVNIQQKLAALHHLDAPYRPSDIEQRNGRGVRQGNTNSEVYIGYYSTKGTFDNYRWQILEKKQQIISQVMSGKPAARTCEDIDEVALTFSEMKAATTGNPLIAEKMTVDNEVNRLKLLQTNYIQQKRNFEHDISTRYPDLISRKERAFSLVSKDKQKIENTPKLAENEFCITIDGNVFTERAKAGEELERMIIKYTSSEKGHESQPMKIGEYNGFKVLVQRDGLEYRLMLKDSWQYYCDYSGSGLGGITRLCNLYEKIPQISISVQQEIDQAKKQLENAKIQVEKPFAHEQELKDLLERQSKINAELDFGKEKEVVLDEDSSDENENMEM